MIPVWPQGDVSGGKFDGRFGIQDPGILLHPNTVIAIIKEVPSNKWKSDPFRVIELTLTNKTRVKDHITRSEQTWGIFQ